MRMLGVLGGMSWESTVTYYQLLNRGVRDRLGGLHSAPLLLHSVDFALIAAQQKAGEWDAAGQVLVEAARGLEGAGATALLLATNTMHKVAAAIEQAVDIPLLHIGDAVGQALQGQGVERAALLGRCVVDAFPGAPATTALRRIAGGIAAWPLKTDDVARRASPMPTPVTAAPAAAATALAC